jgi:CelD/BcsL family acetyltransferase involved in cellulose biosynthesis
MTTAILAADRRVVDAQRMAPALEIRDVRDRASFAGLEQEWNALVEKGDCEPFYRHEFLSSFVDSFVPKAPLKLVAGHDPAGRLVAALPLVARRGSICGIPVRELASPTNVHSLRFDLVAADAAQAGDAVMRHLAADRSWDVVRITDVPEGGKAWEIHRAAQAAGFPVGVWEAQRSPYIQLPSVPGELLRGRRTKFKANLRRRWKRLAEAGEVSVERVAGSALSEQHLNECLLLESSGWKGRQGSAVNQNGATRAFHLRLLRSSEFNSRLSLFLLKLDGKPIAFHYGLTSHGVYSLVMTSYDERFKEFSPGHLLTEEVLEDCVRRGLREFDFLGCDLPWKLEWTSTVRPHHWLFIFRDNAMGRALCALKFRWVPAARAALARWKSQLGPAPVVSNEVVS